MRKVVWSLLLAGLLVGCENVGSDDINTGGVYASLTVTADGSGSSRVYAALKVGGQNSNTFLDLVGGDTLLAYQDTDSSAMIRKELLQKVWYEASFATDAEDTPFQVSFLRVHTGDGTESCTGSSAPDSYATLPAPYLLTGPAPDTSFSRATDDVAISWDTASGDPMSWTMNGDCIQLKTSSFTDSGSVTIPAAEFVPEQNEQASTCNVTVVITRSRGGTVDANYGEGGSFVAYQVRTVQIQSAP